MAAHQSACGHQHTRVDLCRRYFAKHDGSRTAYQRYKEVHPDVAVIDISMPGRGGIDLIGQLRAWDASARIVVFTMHKDAVYAMHAFQAGAMGYITKSSNPLLLAEAIIDVFATTRDHRRNPFRR